MQNDIDIRLFSEILADAIQNRAKKLRRIKQMKIEINELQMREIESMFQLDHNTRTQEIYNDVICDVLDSLGIDYEIDRKTGIHITRENE
jgi:hypothetical protein